MGKKKITTGEESTEEAVVTAPAVQAKVPKKKFISGTLHVEATFNNTKVSFSDKSGNTLFWSSSGSLRACRLPR